MSKKLIIIIILAICLLSAGGYYWWMGTPQYSVSQIKKAFEKHDSELGLKYIDVDSIFENFWSDMKGELMDDSLGVGGFEMFGMMLGLQMVENMKPMMKEQVNRGIEDWFSESVENQERVSTNTEDESRVGIIWQKDIEIKKEGDSAYIDIFDNIKIVLSRKEGERYWVVSKIEGFSEMLNNFDFDEEDENSVNILKEKIDVELIDKGFISSDWERGIYSDYITAKIKLINKTDKDIKGVQGKIIFYDIFDDEIYRTTISYDEGILKNESEIWDGSIEYNQFEDGHKKLKSTELENLKYEWVPEEIIYQDGTKETNN